MLQQGTFDGRVAVVTGGGSGIGEAISRELARLGAKIALVGRTRDKLDAVCADINAAGGTAKAYQVDIRDRSRVEAVIDSVIVDFGRIDHLVNNAVGNFRVAPEEMSPNAWNAVVDIVPDGTWHCTQTVGKHMIERGGGSILNIGSTMSKQGGPATVHSASAKAGVRAMNKSLGTARGRYGIRVNVLIPGMTEGTTGAEVLHQTEEAFDQAVSGVPLGRLATRKEIAQAASYLLIALIETAHGVPDARTMASTPGVRRLVFGGHIGFCEQRVAEVKDQPRRPTTSRKSSHRSANSPAGGCRRGKSQRS
ncbi:SDR family NAD(P)-dependent oxidoreductase [Streptomyces sp. NPDC001292]|uniref:SDR family NAD(P)-dependent oxidoreductase n=1 Tax=Streptomyces sp. NPDC001292 TaxID=3364558 RepID=UPI003676853E